MNHPIFQKISIIPFGANITWIYWRSVYNLFVCKSYFIRFFSVVLESDFSKLSSLIKLVGGPVVSMPPENIVLIARVGSYLYGLSTPQSDADYTVVYVEPHQVSRIIFNIIIQSSLFFLLYDLSN